jgi:glycosyltransferase involved in cell wall biosynthesis
VKRRAADRIVFVAGFPPWPLTSGAPIRMHRLISGLSSAFHTTVVTHDGRVTGPEGAVGAPEIRRALPDADQVVVVPEGPLPKRVSQLGSLCRGRSYGNGRYASPALRRAVRSAAAGAALVHFDTAGGALTGPIPGAVNVVAPHNVDSVLTRRSGRDGALPRRVFAEVEARKQEREERSIWENADLCVTVSEADAAQLRGAGAGRVIVCPNGTDPVDRLPPPTKAATEPLRLLFVGTGAYRPNALGLEWFVGQVLPRVQAAVVVDVVGRRPPHAVAAANVCYHGRVPDVAPFYARSDAVVVPVPFGSGTRLKVVEAMAFGRPVVSTSAGAEGLGACPGVHYLEAETPEAFAASLDVVDRAVTAGSRDLERMLVNARGLASGLFWPGLVEDLVERYRAAIASSAVPGAPVTAS